MILDCGFGKYSSLELSPVILAFGLGLMWSIIIPLVTTAQSQKHHDTRLSILVAEVALGSDN